MNKLEHTKEMITFLEGQSFTREIPGKPATTNYILADIAQSLAIIADSCEKKQMTNLDKWLKEHETDLAYYICNYHRDGFPSDYDDESIKCEGCPFWDNIHKCIDSSPEDCFEWLAKEA